VTAPAANQRPWLPPKRMRISFFFPAYGDENTVEPLARTLDEVLSRVATEHEIIIVDDASPDRSGAIADRLAAENPRIRVVHHPKNRGYGQAVWSGLKAARYEWVGFTDGDMQYDVNELPRFVDAAASGADFVLGYKPVRAEGWKREVTSALHNASIRALLGLQVKDVDCAFKLINRRFVDDFTPSFYYQEAFVLVELLYRAQWRGARIVELPVKHRDREFGVSQCFTWRTARRLAWNTLRGAAYGRVLGAWR
jgi:glycosyltransferase involved in cell wall biosynthesis